MEKEKIKFFSIMRKKASKKSGMEAIERDCVCVRTAKEKRGAK